MRTTGFLAALFLTAGVTSSFADEKCRSELEAAFTKQAGTGKMRSLIESPIVGAMSGRIERTIDAVRPDKIYSRVKSSAEEGLAETIVIGNHAWSNSGMGWDEVKPNIAMAMSMDVAEMMKPQKVGADFSCLGKVSYAGKEYLGYSGAPGKAGDGVELKTTVYVDTASGLPAFNIIAPASGDGEPRLKMTYSYTEDIAVESPMPPVETMSDTPAAAAGAEPAQK